MDFANECNVRERRGRKKKERTKERKKKIERELYQ